MATVNSKQLKISQMSKQDGWAITHHVQLLQMYQSSSSGVNFLWDSVQMASHTGEMLFRLRDGNGHNFPYMDMQDNSHRDDWGGFGTPTYFWWHQME